MEVTSDMRLTHLRLMGLCEGSQPGGNAAMLDLFRLQASRTVYCDTFPQPSNLICCQITFNWLRKYLSPGQFVRHVGEELGVEYSRLNMK